MHFFEPSIVREQGSPPFSDPLWDLPAVTKTLKGTGGSDLLLGVKGSLTPIFSSADQILHTNRCIGNLQFLKPLDHSRIILQRHPDGSTIDVIAPQSKWAIIDQPKTTCVDPTRDFLNVDLHVGGAGPGSQEMARSEQYATVGPQFLGTLEQGIGPNQEDVYCIKPSAVRVVDINFDPQADLVTQQKIAIRALGRKAFR